MKTNFLMKIAVVFMAAFGAYAFSGSANSPTYSYKEGIQCNNVAVNCSNTGTIQCRVKLKSTKEVMDVWDLDCVEPTFHLNNQILDEI